MITWYLIVLDCWLIWLRPDRDDHPSGGGGTVVDLAQWRRDHGRRAA